MGGGTAFATPEGVEVNKTMKITLWGVRGSIATSGPEFARVGGDTTCVEVQAAGSRLIVDAGTGVRALGAELLREARALGQPVEATFLFTHLHWDHIQGFPFFAPAFVPGATLALYGPTHADGSTLEQVLRRQMQPPSFPVPLEAMAAHKTFGLVAPGDELGVGPFRIQVLALRHPQGSLGYRIEALGRSLCIATDTEHPEDGSVDDSLLELGRDVDLLIHDAQYTQAEYEGQAPCGPSRRGWGHSTHLAAAEAARAARAKRLLLFHHDPTHDDDMVDAIECDAQRHFAACRAARQRACIELG
jgi:phosphoribosyl 1,2-cyclic phosphodiesterase